MRAQKIESKPTVTISGITLDEANMLFDFSGFANTVVDALQYAYPTSADREKIVQLLININHALLSVVAE